MDLHSAPVVCLNQWPAAMKAYADLPMCIYVWYSKPITERSGSLVYSISNCIQIVGMQCITAYPLTMPLTKKAWKALRQP